MQANFSEMPIIFGTSGWRGKLDLDFNLTNIGRVTQGVAEYYTQHIRKGSILIGFDPRRGNPEFALEIASILAANNIPVRIILEEPTPTPVLAYLANSNEEITGVINLTASHNKYTDNGFKYSPHHGGAADKETTNLISKYATATASHRRMPYESAKAKGLIQEVSLREVIEKYIEGYAIPILRRIKAWEAIVDYARYDQNFRLILDPMQGTSVRYLEEIYRRIELEVGRHFVEIIHTNNRDPSFTQVNGAPNPTEPDSIKELVLLVSRDAHTLGLATDGDGDRFGVIDFTGEEIPANDIIAMLAYFLAQKGLRGAIGKTVATSSFVNAVAEHLGLELIETAVGFKWFVEKAVEEEREFLVAGEESAHIGVSPFMKSWDDGIAIGIMCLWMIAETRNSLASYKEKIESAIGKRYFYRRENIELTQKLKEKAAVLIQQTQQEKARGAGPRELSITQMIEATGVTQKIDTAVTIDGLKVVLETGDWLCIRLSGTENVARLYTEATDVERQDYLRYIGKALLGLSPEQELSLLIQASGKQSKGQIPETNLYRELGFEDDSARLGWVVPPTWQDIERTLEEFLSLDVVKGKTNFIFSGMGGSINTIKALIQILRGRGSIKLYTIDSLDPAALKELLSLIDDLSQTLVIGISKSGTTKETQDLLRTLRERFQTQNLKYQQHFLWLTDIPQGRQKIENAGWQGAKVLPIQVDNRTDIGGRFTAPHTLILLVPLLLLLNRNLDQLKVLWYEYLRMRQKLILESVRKACELANTDVKYFSIVLEAKLAQALETWIIQLFQESLGSKITGFNPKTMVVAPGARPKDFEEVGFPVVSPDAIVEVMLNMYLLQVFVAIFAYYKRINFVTQPEVEIYKRKMNEVSFQESQVERVTSARLIEKIIESIEHRPQTKFLEVVCYWYLKDDQRNHLKQILKAAFPDREIFVFAGSDWNHHSYQAASWNYETLFIILIKHGYVQHVEGISPQSLRENISTLRAIAYASYVSLKEKSTYLEVDDYV